MNKKLKWVMLTITATMLVTSLSACKKQEAASSASSEKKDPVTLNVYLFGEENKHMRNVDPIIQEFEKETKSTLNTTLKITWTPPADYGQKLPLWISSGENMDLCFSAPWQGLDKLAKDGAFADVGKYFNNDQYPGLKKAFPTDYINNNKLFDKTYAIPVTNTFMDMEGIWYRKDLLDKYGMKVTSYDDLYNFLTKVGETEKDVAGFGNYGTTAFFKLFTDPNARQLNGKVFSFIGGNPAADYINVQISDDGKSVKGVAAYGDSDDVWKDFDSKYGKQYLYDEFNQCVRFNKFVPKDVLTPNSAGTGKANAAGFVTLSNFQNTAAQEKAKHPGAEIGFWPIYKNNQDMTPGTQSTDYKAWNFLCVPASSKNIDRTMDFLNWVFADQKNNDLFTYGIEGTNWTAVGTNQWKVKDGVNVQTNYMFPGYEMTWNPTLQRMPAGLTADVQKYYEYEFKQDTFKKNVLAGFSFNQDPVKNEVAKCTTVASKYLPFLCSGVGEVDKNMKDMNKDLKDAGVDKVKDELKKQINDYLTKKK